MTLPQCASAKTTYPQRGRRCLRPALAGSDYCIAHDPERRAEIVIRLEDARTHQTKEAT